MDTSCTSGSGGEQHPHDHGDSLCGRVTLPLAVYEAELEYIAGRRQPLDQNSSGDKLSVPPEAPLVGMSISGGGIRSATFGLGVLQGLARYGLLRSVDYLCTVSGGGYIGSCLTSLMSVPKRGDQSAAGTTESARWADAHLEKQKYDLGENMPLLDTAQVHHLRKHGDFLIARRGFFRQETLRVIGTLLTGVACSLALYLVLMAAIAAVFILYSSLLTQVDLFAHLKSEADAPGTWFPADGWKEALHALGQFAADFVKAAKPNGSLSTIAAGVGGLLAAVGTLLMLVWPADRFPRHQQGRSGESGQERGQRRQLQIFASVVILVGIGLPILLRAVAAKDAMLAESVQSPMLEGLPLRGLTLPLAYFAGAAVAVGALYALVVPRRASMWNMRSRSLVGAAVGICVHGVILSILSAGLVGFTAYWLAAGNDLAAIIGALLSAGVTRLLAGFRDAEPPRSSLMATLKSAAVRIGLYVAVFVLILITTVLCIKVLIVYHVDDGFVASIAAVLALIAFVALGYFVEFNRISLHYFYRDRLAETYLMTERREKGELVIVRNDNALRLCEMHDYYPDESQRPQSGRARNVSPYHLVLCSLNLSGSRDLARKDRKSDHFVFSREFCGSTTTGYVRTKAYRHGRTKLSLAMTISGAAVSSGMGFYTSFVQSFAVTLFNIRLGYWLVNPRVYDNRNSADEPEADVFYPKDYQGTPWPKEEPQREMQARHVKDWLENIVFWPKYLYYEMTASTNTEQPLVNLSDGGHTGDNIGLYPLLQRRCELIFASDGEADPKYNFGSLSAAIRQIFIDENVVVDIDFSQFSGKDRQGAGRKERSPAKEHFVIGRIRYPSAECNADGQAGANTPFVNRRYQPSIGWIVYLKSSYVGDHEPAAVTSYAETHSFFPHETTGDQFFDDDQFEAYRALGHHIAETVAACTMERAGRASTASKPLDARAVIEFCRWHWEPTRELLVDAWLRSGQDADAAANTLGIPKDRLQQLLEQHRIRFDATSFDDGD